ncbi:MAG: hypothetical protein ACLPRE_11370 [Limisphaerales bacterium]
MFADGYGSFLLRIFLSGGFGLGKHGNARIDAIQKGRVSGGGGGVVQRFVPIGDRLFGLIKCQGDEAQCGNDWIQPHSIQGPQRISQTWN